MRYLGAEMQGIYSYILSIVFLLSFITDFGLSSLLVREVKIAGDESPKFLGNAIILQVFQILASGAFIIVYSLAFEKNPATRSSLLPAAFAITLMYLANPFIAALNSHEKMYLSGLANGLASFLNAVFIFISIKMKFSLPQVILMLGASNVLNVIISSFLCLKFAIKPVFKFDFNLIKTMIKMSLPFALMGLFNYMYEKVNVLILFNMTNAVQAGYYTGASKIIEILNAFTIAIMGPVYPRLSMVINTETKEKAIKVINLSVKYMAFAVAPCALFVSVFSPEYTRLLLGQKFAASAPALSFLIWTIFLMSMHVIPAYALNAARLTKLVTLVYGINIIINLGLNFTLIPRFGYLATAGTAVACNLFALATLVFFTHRHIGKTDIPVYALKIFISLLPSLSLILYLRKNVNFIIVSLMSLVVFFVAGLLFGYFDLDDYKLFGKMLSGGIKLLHRRGS